MKRLTTFSILSFACAGAMLAAAPLRAADEPAGGPVDVGQQIPGDQAPKLTVPSGEKAEEIAKLIKQLGDEDFKTRDAASAKLKEMGPAALDALAQAGKDANPEISSRADALVKQITRKPSLFGRPNKGQSGAIHSERVQMTVINGAMQTSVFEGDQRIDIAESPGNIAVTITGTDDGKPVTETVKAATVEELRTKNPEAAALYDRWGNGGARRGNGVFQFGNAGGGLRIQGGPLIIRGQANAQFNVVVGGAVQDELTKFRTRLRVEMVKQQLPADKQQDVLKQLDEVEAARNTPLAPGQSADQRSEAFNQKSDAFRQKLAELKLPDPGDALPPPAKGRLGVFPSGETPDGIVVGRVMEASRAERFGLKVLDVIHHVDGKPVTSVAELKKALMDSGDKVVLEVRRDGKDMKLEEKAP